MIQDTTLVLAILLGSGFAVAKLGQRIRLPSVTGYILAGLLLGPTCLSFVTEDSIGSNLKHFTQIALMLIAFGIGEHLDIKRLKHSIKAVGCIGLAETSGAFLLVSIGTFFVSRATEVGMEHWHGKDYAILALLLGAVSVATAPAATLHVIKELKAVGPLTTILMAVVAIDDGLAIIMFSMAISVARNLVGSGDTPFLVSLFSSCLEIGGSLIIGIITGLVIDFTVNKLKRQSEMLTIGLALLLLCGEGARLFGLSPLLSGMAAGFTIVNRHFRDVRIFRALNAFEPPIYVLFFTLAGAQLHLSALALAGWLGFVYFLFRGLGKIIGAYAGARLTKTSQVIRNYLGVALIPQAGVAIGLVFLIQSDQNLAVYATIITPVVLAGVVISELVGPVFARIAVEKAGEVADEGRESAFPDLVEQNGSENDVDEFQLVPWTWEQLKPAQETNGFVLFATSHTATSPGLARMATLFAHHYHALPLAVQVKVPGQESLNTASDYEVNLSLVTDEVKSLGYCMVHEVILADDVASGILSSAAKHKAWSIVLGYPLNESIKGFQQVVESVALKADCPVIVARFTGVLHTERILVPITSSNELKTLSNVINALSRVGMHRVTLLRLMPSNVSDHELEQAERKLFFWAEQEQLTPYVRCQALVADARQETIVNEACKHDLVIMPTSGAFGFKRIFFGSLAEGVARECRRPMLIVYSPTVKISR